MFAKNLKLKSTRLSLKMYILENRNMFIPGSQQTIIICRVVEDCCRCSHAHTQGILIADT